ncbi:stage III sporulation protein AF [Paenibacillus sp. DMB20]|uniref:stage III sporulation protein AF n=1 Tax=Paenibacillus sp. DMB20 TaxID=1642570 RepID=UPI000627A4F3|nr:stage III sporulation protein AF [Paenibacillus sp. DMB20]KKO52084.1 hypothetical protein XI25_21735 [Paenibacillus sp. DMB20]
MDWLSGWLKSVIIVVMFAAFVDLILPGKTMQRYARLVLSMLILLALLRPVVNLLTEPPENKLALELDALEKGRSVPEEASLERILAQAEKLKDAQRQQSLQWAAEEVAKKMKEEITEETGEPVGAVEVVLKAAGDKGTIGAVIASVDVRLLEPEAQEDGSKAAGKSGSIKPIDPVRVNVDISVPESGTNPSQPEDYAEAEARLQARAVPIRKLLSSRWNMKDDQISVTSSEANDHTKL